MLALLTGGFLMAQPTLTQADFNFPAPPFNDTATIFNNPASVTLPTHGPNQTWDYSNVGNTSRIYYEKDVAVNPKFPNADFIQPTSTNFNGLGIPSNSFRGVDASGFLLYGYEQQDTSFVLTAITGSSSDTLTFTNRSTLFKNPHRFVAFPLAYGNTWSDKTQDSLDFKLTVGAFVLKGTPGLNTSVATTQSEVVGHGNIILPKADGSPTKSISALLVKTVRRDIDSIFLAGAPAPSALLSAFGTVQGAIANDSAYYFYTPNFPYPVMVIEFSPFGTREIEFRPRAENASFGLTDYVKPELQAYPNPVHRGGYLHFRDLPKGEKATIQVYDLAGKLIFNQNLLQEDHEYTLAIPENIIPGMYQFEVHSGTTTSASPYQGSILIK